MLVACRLAGLSALEGHYAASRRANAIWRAEPLLPRPVRVARTTASVADRGASAVDRGD
jgi:hypothetical protein